jgi:hypothetical protein
MHYTFDFVPVNLFDIVPEIDGTNWWPGGRPFVFWFNLTSDGRFGLVIEVGPLTSVKFNREALAKELLKHFKSGKEITSKFTRVYSEYIKTKLTDDQRGDPDEIQKIMNSLYGNVESKHLIPVTKIIGSFFAK